jgi:hypothetical protein
MQTSSEIRAEASALMGQRKTAAAKIAAIQAARLKNQIPAPPQLDDKARARIARLAELKGQAPPQFTANDEEQLEVEAIDEWSSILTRRAADAEAAESAVWAEENAGLWRELVRQALLAALRLRAAQHRIAGLLSKVLPGTASSWIMTEFVTGDAAHLIDRLDAAAAQAVSTWLVSPNEISKAGELGC